MAVGACGRSLEHARSVPAPPDDGEVPRDARRKRAPRARLSPPRPSWKRRRRRKIPRCICRRISGRASPAGCCSGSRVAFATFQIVTAFGIPLNRGLAFGVTLDPRCGVSALRSGPRRSRGVLRGEADRRTASIAFVPMLASFVSSPASAAACRARCCAPCMSASSACSRPACWRSTARRERRRKGLLVGASAALAFLAGLYQWEFYYRPRRPRRQPDRADLVVGVVAIVTLFLLVWRVHRAGAADRRRTASSPIACSAICCPRRSTIAATISRRWWSTWSSAPRASTALPTAVSATYIFLFILFGSFMEQAGVIRFFNEISIGAVRRHARRARKGLRRLLGADGHRVRLRRRQCRRLRPVHHSADEALRLSRRLRRRRRGDLLDGRADHAAGDGRRRLHHGRDDRRALIRDRRRRRSSRRCSISPPASGRCISRPASSGCTACRAASCRASGRSCATTGT